MSMITCPECGQSISSTAPQCIHCGCEFQICPECTTVLLKGSKECTECGYIFKEESAPPKAAAKNDKTLIQHYRIFKGSSAFISFITSDKLRTVLRIIAFVIAAIATFRLLTWDDVNNLEEALNAAFGVKELIKSISAMYIIGAVIWLGAAILGRFSDYIRKNAFDNYLRAHDLDITTLIDKEFQSGFERLVLETYDERVGAICDTFDVLMMRKTIMEKLNSFRHCIIASVCSLTWISSFCIFFVKNVEAYIKYTFWYDDFGWKNLELIWLPIAGIVACFVLGSILSAIFIGKTESNDVGTWRSKWINDNLPQHAEAYDKYIENYLDLRLDLT